MKTQNISSELVSLRSASQIAGCEKMQSNLQNLIDGILADVNRNIEKVLPNQTEAECFVDVLRTQKFIEVNIVLPAAQMTNRNEIPHLDDVYSRSKNIFLFAVMKCLMSEDSFKEIFIDFSTKMNVNDHEFECIKRRLQPDDDIENTTASEQGSGETESWTEGNKIVRKSMESSAESELNTENCEETCQRIEDKITHFEFPSLNEAENTCMSEKVTRNDIDSVLEFIVMRKMSKLPEETTARNEKMKSLITGYVWNIIECTNILQGFSDIIDTFLPPKSQ